MSDAVLTAKLMGLEVATITRFPNDKYANLSDKLIVANPQDPIQALKAAKILSKNVKFQGVISIGVESAISVAEIASKYALPGPSIDVAKTCTIKSLRAERLREKNIPTPEFRLITNEKQGLKAIDEIGLPIVVKPVDNCSAKGVSLVRRREDFAKALNEAKQFSNVKKIPVILVEKYISGTEHSTEVLTIGSKFYNTGFTDRNYLPEYLPHFVEEGDTLPTRLKSDKKESIESLSNKAAKALGIKNWVAKGDMVLTDKGPMVFEIACRIGGPKLGTEIVPLSNGTNILKAHIQTALDCKVDRYYLKPKYERGVEFKSFFAKTNGKLVSVTGDETVSSMKGVYYYAWAKPRKRGTIILKPRNFTHMLGYIITVGQTSEIAKNIANDALKKMRIKCTPL